MLRPSDPVARPNHSSRHEPSSDDIADFSEKSYSVTPPARENKPFSFSSQHSLSRPQSQPQPADLFESAIAFLRPSPSDVALGFRLYFEYCHRQPIWCFERDEISDVSAVSDELACSILALTSRFSRRDEELKTYGSNARNIIMVRIANGNVSLATVESLCLLSYASFIGKEQAFSKKKMTPSMSAHGN